MIRAIAIAACGALLAGCGPTVVAPSKPDPIDVRVPAECIVACTCDVPPLLVTTNPYSAMDAADYEHRKGKACLAQCELRRLGCADAIKRGREAGVIR